MPIIDFITSHWVLMILLLIASIINLVWLFLNRKELKMNLAVIILFSVFHTIIGVIFVVLFAFMESGFKLDSLGNLSLYGGVFFMPIVYVLYALIRKINIGRAFDIFTISLISTLFFARINCIISGCCGGIEVGDTGFRVPTRELELLFYVLFIIFTSYYVYRKESNGLIYPVYMIAYGLFRFIIEFLRESDSSSWFHMGHTWSILSLIIGILIIVVVKYLRGKNHEKEVVSK